MAREALISGKSILLLSAVCLAALPAPTAAQTLDAHSQDAIERDNLTNGRSETGGGSYGDQNRGGSRGFYSFPRHRSIADGGTAAAQRPFSPTDTGISPLSRNTHGSAYYGRNYGAPYFNGGYYDRGTYYRERRD
jgi:hypothetical protein